MSKLWQIGLSHVVESSALQKLRHTRAPRLNTRLLQEQPRFLDWRICEPDDETNPLTVCATFTNSVHAFEEMFCRN